ncbi:hypothetical protein BV20DRAFT_863059 [Pilatotrama ljubarskyi]|nr:hypothetical protein BV20DRAFT_863059 [Pilatotrama ljubarskyi]
MAPRDANVIVGLQALRDALPTLKEGLYKADKKVVEETVNFGTGTYHVIVRKEGVTQTGVKSLPYKMVVYSAEGVAVPGYSTLHVHLRPPSESQPAANQRGLASGIEYLLQTESSLSKDIDATKLEE